MNIDDVACFGFTCVLLAINADKYYFDNYHHDTMIHDT